MEAFTHFKGLVAPIDRANVDTDQIIPKQFLKSIQRTGFGDNLFDEWRYMDYGEPGMDCSNRPINPEFVLNRNRFTGSQVLVARRNFGCGSSREHAPWALIDYGIRVLIAPSFADIFHNNCFKNGLLAITLNEDVVDRLFTEVEDNPGYELSVDLDAQTITTPGGEVIEFSVDPFRRHCLLNGLDEIGLTLQHADEIRAFESTRRETAPWMFSESRA